MEGGTWYKMVCMDRKDATAEASCHCKLERASAAWNIVIHNPAYQSAHLFLTAAHELLYTIHELPVGQQEEQHFSVKKKCSLKTLCSY